MTASSKFKGFFVDRYLSGKSLTRGAKRLFNKGKKATVFYRVDDPYSHLLAQALPLLTEQYEIEFEWVIVPEPSVDSNPEPILQAAYAKRDCAVVAAHLGLSFPTLVAENPTQDRLRRANAILIHPRDPQDQIAAAIEVGEAIWNNDGPRLTQAGTHFGSATGPSVNPALDKGHARLRKEGHYQSGMVLYNGDWFWGVDRVQHLADAVAADRGLSTTPLFATHASGQTFGDATIDFFFSFRSPYSYIAIERLCRLNHGLQIRLRPVLPMVSRGLPAPTTKKLYILKDANREAARHGIAFGKICDPLPGVERCLAVFYAAEREGRGMDFARACFTGAWSQSKDVTSDLDLLSIVESIGWNQEKLTAALSDEGWKEDAERNRIDLRKQGLWGVPSFAIQGDSRGAFWGQDRLALLDPRLGDPGLFGS